MVMILYTDTIISVFSAFDKVLNCFNKETVFYLQDYKTTLRLHTNGMTLFNSSIYYR